MSREILNDQITKDSSLLREEIENQLKVFSDYDKVKNRLLELYDFLRENEDINFLALEEEFENTFSLDFLREMLGKQRKDKNFKLLSKLPNSKYIMEGQ